MKFWRHSVKSRANISKLLIFLLAISSVAFVIACQTAQLAEYHKFNDDGEVPRISLEDAKKEFDAGTAIFVDSRAEMAYDQEHITGAINISNFGDDKVNTLPKNKKIIVYCS